MFYIVIAAWLVGVIVSLINGNRRLPLIIFVIGAAATALQFTVGLGYPYLIIMAVAALVIWFANKMDMT